MTTFNDREKSFERKFANDAELRFKVEARRNKLLGLWAAEKLGLGGTQAEDYAKTVVLADLEEPGDEDLVRKVLGDFEAKKVSVSDAELRRKIAEFLQQAISYLRDGGLRDGGLRDGGLRDGGLRDGEA